MRYSRPSRRLGTLLVTLAVAAMLLGPTTASAQTGLSGAPADPADVIADAPGLDGTSLVIRGEVIGDRLHSGTGHVWVNILGDADTAIGVWLPKEDTEAIEVYGDYHHEGDIVLVEGTLNAACDLHGGDLDLHADSIEIVAPGHDIERPADPLMALFGIIAIGLAGVLQRTARARRHRAPRPGG